MNVAMLSTLVAIVDRGSFAAAAQEVGCTPSAVSLQMKQLEAWFGQPLFDRSARTVKPMPFALEAAAVARDFSARLEALRAPLTSTVSGRVRLGAIASVQAGALPQALRAVRDRHPALDVEVSLDDSDKLLVELKAGRIDAAVLVRPQSGGSSRLSWQNLGSQPFVLLAPPGTSGTSAHELLRRLDLIRYDTALTGGQIAARYVAQLAPRARASPWRYGRSTRSSPWCRRDSACRSCRSLARRCSTPTACASCASRVARHGRSRLCGAGPMRPTATSVPSTALLPPPTPDDGIVRC